MAAYQSVPTSSATFTEAQVASARTLAATGESVAPPTVADIQAAAATIDQARIDTAEKSRLAIEVLVGALRGAEDGSITESPQAQVFGEPMTALGIRRSLEATYRELARVAATAEERFELVDKANRVRPRTLV